MSKIRVLPQCKIPRGKRASSTLSAVQLNNISARRRPGKVRTPPSDSGTNMSDGAMKQKLLHCSFHKTKEMYSPRLGFFQSNKRLINLYRKFTPWALAAAFHSLLFLLLSAGAASGELSQARLPDGKNLIPSFPHALHPGTIQGKERVKFCSVA